MPVTELKPGKDVRRVVQVIHKLAAVPFDITMNGHGLTFRRPKVNNRTTLFAPWHIILQNVRNERKGYRIWSLEEAWGHLGDVSVNPEQCPWCGQIPKKNKKKGVSRA